MKVSHAFDAILRLAEARGVGKINQLPGCWEIVVDGWQIAVNGHDDTLKSSFGTDVEPYHATIAHADYIAVMIVGLQSGVWAGDPQVEDDFIAAVEAEIAEGETDAVR